MNKEAINSNLYLSLKKASSTIYKIYNSYILRSETGINSIQFNTLLALSFYEGKNVTYIAKELCVDRTTLSRNLLVLKRDNLVDFRPDKIEGRCKICFITESGKLVLKKCMPFFESAKNEIQNKIGKAILERLSEDLMCINKL
jgi:DNA-binding MarR family transcriptional regulator